MADPTFEAQQLAEAIARVNRDLAEFGRITVETQRFQTDVTMESALGLKNFSKSTDHADKALEQMTGAALKGAGAMLEGAKGASAFNGSIDSMTEAGISASKSLFLLAGPLGVVAKVVAVAIAAFGAYAKAANEMADKQYKAFGQLAKSGLAAGDGMAGVYRDAKKLGLSMNELDSMISVMADRSEDLALLGGSATRGAKQLAEMGEGLRGSREGFLNLGMSMGDVTAGLGRYTQTMTRAGRAQNMTQEQLTAGAKNYILEQDRLAKLTGISAQKQQDILDRARENEQFNAKIRELELQNTAESRQAADGLRKGLILASQAGEGVAQGFMGAVNKNLANPETRKLMMSSQGEILTSVGKILEGADPTDAIQTLFKAMSSAEKTLTIPLGKIGASSDNFVKGSEMANAANLALMDKAAIAKQLEIEQAKQLAGKMDPATAAMAKLKTGQITANESMENFVNAGIIPATEALGKFVDVLNYFLDMFGFATKSKEVKQKTEAAETAKSKLNESLQGATTMQKIGIGRTEEQDKAYAAYRKAEQELLNQQADERQKARKKSGLQEPTVDMSDIPMAAQGGVLTGPDSGYLAMLHGTEAVVPLGDLGLSAEAMKGTKDTGPAEQIATYISDISKDLVTQSKVIDKDTTGIKKFSDFQENYHKKTQEYMDKILEFADENPPSSIFGAKGAIPGAPAGGAGAAGGAAGASSAISAKSAGASARPAGASAPEGQGAGAVPKAENVMAFGDRSGSRSNFEALDDALQTAVIKAAEEYNTVTGKKIKINSAARDPADQERIYAESVEAGRPGIGPNGMPIGKPGTSKHEKGLAVDIQNYSDPQAVAAFNRQGLFQKVPSDPVHFTFENGGVASGPKSGYGATLHGDEAVIPLNNGAGNFVKLFESMAESNRNMVSMMQEMIDAQKNSVSVQEKMLRMTA